LGLLINERSGVVNLGAEGMMLVAAIAGFATGVHTHSDWLGLCGGCRCRGAAWPRLFGFLVIYLNTNQYATGLALELVRRTGLSAFVGIALHPGEAGRAGRSSTSQAWLTCHLWGQLCFAIIPWSTEPWH
jgi:ABC-type uncharacterized transport system permease subunit